MIIYNVMGKDVVNVQIKFAQMIINVYESESIKDFLCDIEKCMLFSIPA